MGAIDNFLKRRGFAKLDRYGLVLTADDRVISTRPAILDDGLGGKIVGWLEDDLAAMELDRWGASKPARPKRLTAPASLHRLPAKQAPLAVRTSAPAAPATPAAPAPSAVPVATSPAPAPTRSLPGVAPMIAPPAAPVVAETDEPGEDEWEWEIAMARARAAAEEEEQARVARATPAPAPATRKMIMAKTSPGIAAVARAPKLGPEPEPLPPWPGTEPYNESWADKSDVAPQVMSVLQKKLALQRSTPARATPVVSAPASPRSTVIPVPQLPAAADPRSVRPASYTPSFSRARAARGTGAPATKLEETVRTLAAPPAANDDRTSPYITLPNEVKPSGFAHTKRVAAKER
jgi:hypothetical protein